MELRLLLDCRGEQGFRQRFRPQIEQLIRTSELDTGDMQIIEAASGRVVVLVERKTCTDLVASYNDERIFRELERMMEHQHAYKCLVITYARPGELEGVPAELIKHLNSYKRDIKVIYTEERQLVSLYEELLACCPRDEEVYSVSDSPSVDATATDTRERPALPASTAFEKLVEGGLGWRIYEKIAGKVWSLQQLKEMSGRVAYLRNECNMTVGEISVFLRFLGQQ